MKFPPDSLSNFVSDAPSNAQADRPRQWQVIGITAFTTVLVTYLLLFLILRQWQNRIIFRPIPTANETTPATLGLPYEEVWLPMPNSVQQDDKIHAWWLPGTDPQPGAIAIFLDGKYDKVSHFTIRHHIRRMASLYRLGYSLLVVDYRGFGQSQGDFPTETQVYEDAEIVWRYLTQTQKLEPDKIILYGYAIGGAVAIDLAIKQPNAQALILESSFTSIQDLAERSGLFWMFPLDWLVTQKFDSLSKVETLQVATLFIHGTSDLQVPVEMTQALFAVTPLPKEMVLVSGAGHEDVVGVAGDYYVGGIQRFLDYISQF